MRRILAIAIALAAAPAAQAHHSLIGYDRSQSATLEAQVVEFRFVNPHPILIVTVRGEPWRLEMDNRHELAGIGVTAETFKARDRVVVVGDPGRDEARTLYVRRLDRPSDGLRYQQIGMTPSLSVER